MWTQLSTVERFFGIIIVMGAIVDIFQFSWIVKRSINGIKKKMYDSIRKELLLKELQNEEPGLFLGFAEGEEDMADHPHKGKRKKGKKKKKEKK